LGTKKKVGKNVRLGERVVLLKKKGPSSRRGGNDTAQNSQREGLCVLGVGVDYKKKERRGLIGDKKKEKARISSMKKSKERGDCDDILRKPERLRKGKRASRLKNEGEKIPWGERGFVPDRG